jgi:hypothetical protein
MMDYTYYPHEDDYGKTDIGQNGAITHYTYPAVPSHVQLPLSPQSMTHSHHPARTSLSDIDEALESMLMSPTLDSQSEAQQELELQKGFNLHIPHPELLPDPAPQLSRQSYCLSDFMIQRTLGTGSFGRVHLGVAGIMNKLRDPLTKFISSEQA